jgi:hypothetical protein
MTDGPDAVQIRQFIAGLEGVDISEANGDSFFFYDPERNMPHDRRLPFATIETGESYDTESRLDRPGVFRLNIGVGKQTFIAQCGPKGSVTPDYAALDRIMPHPVYGKMYWLCVLNPSAATYETAKTLIAEAHGTARKAYERRARAR